MTIGVIKRLWLYPKAVAFAIYTLTFNAFQSNSPVADCAFEPIIWLVDHFGGVLGRVLVFLVSISISGVVVIFYIYAVPIVLEYNNILFIVCHLVCGHWLLLNIAFHYYKAVSTSPGYPPSKQTKHCFKVCPCMSASITFILVCLKGKEVLMFKDIQVCTKCIQSKPPRTHHCSVCNKCILKMDHHCPWINNCVGHFNQRYFFLFCVYMCIGTIYVSLTLFPKVLDHLNFFTKDFAGKDIFKYYFNTDIVQPTSGHKKYFMKSDDLIVKENKENMESIHSVIVFEFMLCSCVAVAVGVLASWHAMLISRGETSIESNINKSTRKRMKEKGNKFVNPYNYGIVDNWKMLLGLGRGRGLWSIIMPSSHPQNGDGITWPQRSGESSVSTSGSGKDEVAFLA